MLLPLLRITPACAGSTGNGRCAGYSCCGSPPLARGVLEPGCNSGLNRRITPACAGSTSRSNRGRVCTEDHPRLRGEYKRSRRSMKEQTGSPPLARGVQLLIIFILQYVRITPACAGSTFLFNSLTELFMGSPPLARGVRLIMVRVGSARRITPACAGSTHLQTDKDNLEKDHPRLRGEYYVDVQYSKNHLGSPPLARGVLPLPCITTFHFRITPACAGSTLFFSPLHPFKKDHPRLRGEYNKRTPERHYLPGSPPLARGVLSVTESDIAYPRITPACAGSTNFQLLRSRQARDHPRLRGEYVRRTA